MGTIPKADRQCQLSARAGAQVRPLIARVLADEYWFGNKPPSWPGAPTSKDAKKARKRYIKRLRRFTPKIPEAEEAGQNPGPLQTTSPMHERRMPRMRASVPAVVRLRGEEAGEQHESLELAAVSIAFPKHRTAEDQLDTLDTTKLKRSLSETIKDADGLAWMVGGIDLSLNDDTQKKLRIAWQPQFYGFAEVTSREAFIQGAARHISPTKTAPRTGPDQRM